MTPGGARSYENRSNAVVFKGLRKGIEANQSPGNGPCSRAADICDSLASKEQREREYAEGSALGAIRLRSRP